MIATIPPCLSDVLVHDPKSLVKFLEVIAERSSTTVFALLSSTFSWRGEATAAFADVLNFFQPLIICFFHSTLIELVKL